MRVLKSAIALALTTALIFRIATPVNATTIDTDDVYDLIYSGFEASSAIADIETSLDDVSFDYSSADYTDYDDTWIEDARDFIDSNTNIPQNINSVNTEEITDEQAMATSISYSIACAVWSMNKGRCTINNIGDETAYMFISHYIDRTEYYWYNTNNQYLMDGPSMSENPSYFSKWITSYDRTAYTTYIAQSGAASSFQCIKDIGIEVCSLYENNMAFGDIVDDFDRISTNAAYLRTLLNTARITMDEADLAADIDYISQSILYFGGTESVSYIYSTMIADDNLFRDADSALRSQLISTTIAFSLSVLLGDIAGGVVGIGVSILSFTFDIYMNLFKFAMWVNMRNSFQTREPWRYNDYLTDLYF